MTRRGPDSRDKMRPDATMVEMTKAEQKVHLPHNADSGHALPSLSPIMPNGKVCKVRIVENPDTRYLEKLAGKGAQHTSFITALKSYGYNVEVLTYIPGFGGSTYTSNIKTMKALGIDRSAANILARKTHCVFKNVLKCRRFPERCPHRQTKPGSDPLRVTSLFHWLLS